MVQLLLFLTKFRKMFVDTHSHIYSPEFNIDRTEVLNRAKTSGIKKIVLPNIDSSSIKPMLDLSASYPNVCYPLIGLHPTSVKEDFRNELEIVRFWLDRHQFYGIGEIGLDLFWDQTFVEEQTEVFRIQLQWAKERNLPVVIHVRDSFEEVFREVENAADNNLRGVFHSFTGTLKQAEQIISWGFKIGVNGIVTFKNAGVDKVISQIDPKHLLLETDSPYLAPVPFRGKRNESAHIVQVAAKVAELHHTTPEEIAAITTKNAEEMFGI
jgi:TatD DNase family protein